MSFTNLPLELITIIIYHTIPESFEGLALSCKYVYEICVPFIANYNRLSKGFKNFRYSPRDVEGLGYHPIRSAIDLILWISRDQVIARYIQTADFSQDGWSTRAKSSRDIPQNSRDELILELLTNSQYIKQTGIDHKEHCITIQKSSAKSTANTSSWNPRRRPLHNYSQDATAFLLTLLPNLKKLELPLHWASSRESNKLVEAIIARSKTTRSLSITPSLSQTKAIISRYEIDYQIHDSQKHLERTSAFLALPNVDKFDGENYCIWGTFVMRFAPYLNLKSISLRRCYINHKAVRCLLQHMPNITSFWYLHSTPWNDVGEWNVSLFLEAIEHSVGPNLENLSILDFETLQRSGIEMKENFNWSAEKAISANPGVVLMHGFPRLQRLAFPLELLSKTDVSTRVCDSESLSAAILIPPAVLQILLAFDGTTVHHQALEILINDLISGKKSDRLVLQELNICAHPEAIAQFDEEFATQLEDLRDLGVEVNWTDSDGKF